MYRGVDDDDDEGRSPAPYSTGGDVVSRTHCAIPAGREGLDDDRANLACATTYAVSWLWHVLGVGLREREEGVWL